MFTFVATAVIFLAVTVALGIGVIVQGRRLRGSCGGVGECTCSAVQARACPRRSRES